MLLYKVVANVRFLVDIAKVAVGVNREPNTGLVTKEEVERVARLVLQDKKVSISLRSRAGELKQKAALHTTSTASLDPLLVHLTEIDGHNVAETHSTNPTE